MLNSKLFDLGAILTQTKLVKHTTYLVLIFSLFVACEDSAANNDLVDLGTDDVSKTDDANDSGVNDVGTDTGINNKTDTGIDATADVTPDETPDKRAPNILLIIADDMGLDASPVHSPGAMKPKMPVLESLAANGLTFDNFWTNPSCTPTRATILTGKYGVRTNVLGVTENSTLSTDEISIQSHLKSNSAYRSAVIGKWHLTPTRNGANLNHPGELGVEYYEGMMSGGHDDYSNWTLVKNGVSSTVTEYSTSYFTDRSIDWINEQESADSESPWFLWLAYTAPHSPFHLPPDDLISATNLSGTTADIRANPLPYYLLMLEAMDTEIGRLLESVDRDNTIVIFIGDNGTPGQVTQAPYVRRRTKGSPYQGGVNTPMVVSGAGVTRVGERELAILNSSDIFATVADLAETNTTEIHDSRSFRGLLNGSDYTPRDFTYAEMNTDTDFWTVRNEQYKLIVFENGNEEFYDLIQDPYENDELIIGGLNADQTQAKMLLESYAAGIRN